MNIDLTPLLTGLVLVLASIGTTLITAKLAPKLQGFLKPLRETYPNESAFWEEQIVTAIKGVEKKFGAGQGDQKLTAALIYLQKQAQHYHFTFDEFVVDTMLHAKLGELESAAENSVK